MQVKRLEEDLRADKKKLIATTKERESMEVKLHDLELEIASSAREVKAAVQQKVRVMRCAEM